MRRLKWFRCACGRRRLRGRYLKWNLYEPKIKQHQAEARQTRSTCWRRVRQQKPITGARMPAGRPVGIARDAEQAAKNCARCDMSLSLTGTGSNNRDADFLRDERKFAGSHREDLESRTAGGTKPATTENTNDNCNSKNNSGHTTKTVGA